MRNRALLSIVAVTLTLTLARDVAAQEIGEAVSLDQAAPDDVYLAGREVVVRAPVSGDVVAAAQEVRVEQAVSGDALVAGETVLVEGAIADDVRAAGRTVAIAAPVGGHLVAAGETVTIAPGQRVQDWAWLAGETIAVAGSVGSLRAAGNEVTITGEVNGAADLRGETIRLGPNAIVRGDLRWASPNELIVAEGARIEGGSTRAAYEAATGTGTAVVGILFWVLSFVLAAALLALLLPRLTSAVGERARTSIGRTVLAGFFVVIATPVLVGLSFLSGVLWLLGVVMLAAYLFALAAGLLFGIDALGDLGLELAGRGGASRWARVGAASLAAILVALLAMVPVLGVIVLLATTIVGIGAMALAAWGGGRRTARARREELEPSPA